jgi:hypothetical protein
MHSNRISEINLQLKQILKVEPKVYAWSRLIRRKELLTEELDINDLDNNDLKNIEKKEELKEIEIDIEYLEDNYQWIKLYKSLIREKKRLEGKL